MVSRLLRRNVGDVLNFFCRLVICIRGSKSSKHYFPFSGEIKAENLYPDSDLIPRQMSLVPKGLKSLTFLSTTHSLILDLLQVENPYDLSSKLSII